MSRRFKVTKIEPEWVLEPEVLGTKEKFWYRRTDKALRWLFKYPQANTGHHWAEKIAAEIADLMEINHARVELAVFNGERGSATASFLRRNRQLWHGNQILAGKLFGYDSEARFRHSEHTLEHIFEALDSTFSSREGQRDAKLAIAHYLVFDAVIGNTDRHHENWGIVREQVQGGWRGFVAPSFDHASSLGRELRDESVGICRKQILETGGIGLYAEKGQGAIYWSGKEKKGPSPLELVRLAEEHFPEFFRPALMRVKKLSTVRIEEMLSRIPKDWMTDIALHFVRAFLAYSVSELLRTPKK